MRVQVSGTKFMFPRICACCGATAERTVEVSAMRMSGRKATRFQTQSWPIPYCGRCADHVAANPSVGCATILLIILTGGLWLVVFMVYYLVAKTRTRTMMSKSCASAGLAAAYHHWHGTTHTFDFTSTEFALAFMRSNRRKLVNVDFGVAQQLDESIAAERPSQAPKPAHHSDIDEFVNLVSAIENARGPATRRAALERGLSKLQEPQMRERLQVEAAKIEVRAVLDKVESLKTVAAKRRHISEALRSLRDDAVSDELQHREFDVLEAALHELDS